MLSLQNIDVFYKQTQAVKSVSLTLEKGQIGCLLGPSGCGKTTILRAIAGFEKIQQGKINVRQKLMSSNSDFVAPEKRKIAVVFQDFALFPHLNVEQNVAFGLSHLVPKQRIARVEELLELVELTQHRSQFPHQLSGGQQQRVALARAMAPKPDLLLLDEPFANLDADLREDLARQVRNILKHEHTTALMVTHDQHEAFAIADAIGVMQQGELHQWGSAYDLYHRPATKFVAGFIGEGVFLKGKVIGLHQLETELGTFSLTQGDDTPVDTIVDVLVRPDDIVHDDNSPICVEVIAKSFRGAHIMYQLQLPNAPFSQVQCLALSHHDHQVGEKIGIRLDLEHIILFSADENSNLSIV
ncbi:ABC transporter ATP-binding protein [Aliiglaciecola sp. LCG003]|uniref:ABC transporter ATP-binding protein n=1 Tax=Aliiglaciecola sp. LCG003 TaxID=3053655 RepID=UPI0025731114|nr:ABC transporter ATP-binding protein [Aliiglaciecola sp. LCG003]WJG08123.1 ABC transporter ATP-binding protein [Aliiglaciecola sp. LCG003]